MLPPSSVTRNPSKQKRSASCAELWIIGRSDTTTQRRSALAIIGYLDSWELATASPSDGRHGAGSWPDYKTTDHWTTEEPWSKELGAGNRPDYRTTDHWTTGEQSADRVKASLTRLREDRVKASLTRRCQRSEVGKRNDGEAPRYRLLLPERKIPPKCLAPGAKVFHDRRRSL